MDISTVTPDNCDQKVKFIIPKIALSTTNFESKSRLKVSPQILVDQSFESKFKLKLNMLKKEKDDRGIISERNKSQNRPKSTAPKTSRKLSNNFEHRSKSPSLTIRNRNRSVTPESINFQENPKTKSLFHQKPQGLNELEFYIKDLSKSIERSAKIENGLSCKAESMNELLKDCFSDGSGISLQFYILMSSILKEIKDNSKKENSTSLLPSKLIELGKLLEKQQFYANSAKNNKENNSSNHIKKVETPLSILKDSSLKVTARVINAIRKNMKEKKIDDVTLAFFIMVFSADSVAKPKQKTLIGKDLLNAIRECNISPGDIVVAIRNTHKLIDSEVISNEIIKRIEDLLTKINLCEVDKNSPYLIIYDYLIAAIKYFKRVKHVIQTSQKFKSLDINTENTSKNEISEEESSQIDEESSNKFENILFNEQNKINNSSPLQSISSPKTKLMLKSPPKIKQISVSIPKTLDTSFEMESLKRHISESAESHQSIRTIKVIMSIKEFRDYLLQKISEEMNKIKSKNNKTEETNVSLYKICLANMQS